MCVGMFIVFLFLIYIHNPKRVILGRIGVLKTYTGDGANKSRGQEGTADFLGGAKHAFKERRVRNYVAVYLFSALR